MATAVWHVTMSLDGFIAGPGDSMEWMFRPQYRGPNPQAAEIVQSIGAIVAGRRVGYDLTGKSQSSAAVFGMAPAR